ncbi:MAG: hypothetical protein PHE93_05550 [Clostridia bacterium]|nr:hypothetical protein [Clostridia bacterium]
MQTIIFGGAFDPPHLEHKKICCEAMHEIGADKLVLVPTYLPPHKRNAVIDFSLRVKMLEELFSDCDYEVEICTIERETGKINYASDILAEIAPRYESPLYLIGGDSLLAFESWHKPDEVLSIIPIVVAGRAGSRYLFDKAEELTGKYGGKIRLLDFKGENISSSVIKAKLYLGLDVPLDERIKKIIKDEHLFEEYNDLVKKLKSCQSPELFFHSLAVALRAVDLNAHCNLGLDFDEVFLAALLHDNSKEMLDFCGFDVPVDAIGSPVLHQFLGAERAKLDYGITNTKICDAIRCHTTAKADMTKLEKLIYSADMLAEDRDFDGLDILVKQIYSDFEEGFYACLYHSYQHVLSKNKKMYPLTEQAYQFYNKEYKKLHNIDN